MVRVTKILRQSQRAIQDSELLSLLRFEIKHELSPTKLSPTSEPITRLGYFDVDYDSLRSQDVVLRRKCDSGEEVAVSALLGPKNYEGESTFAWDVLMKVCVRKPGLRSLLQFDCRVTKIGADRSEVDIQEVYFLPSKTSLDPSIYRAPSFSTLDPKLQIAFKEYLEAKGVREYFANLLLSYLHEKEQKQYVDWLRRVELFVEKSR